MFSKLIRTSEFGELPNVNQPSWHLRDRLKAWVGQHATMISVTLVSIILWLVLVIIAFLFFQHQSLISTQIDNTKNATLILSQLNDINSQLQPLSVNSEHSDRFDNAMQSVQTDLVHLQQELTGFIETNHFSQLSSQVTDLHHDVDSQLLDIKNEVAGNDGNKNYLDPHLLPFQVIAVDVITGQAYVSISYDEHIMPLMIGDTLAGWTLIDADYSTSRATFQNNQHQLIQIQIP